jgi:protease-4
MSQVPQPPAGGPPPGVPPQVPAWPQPTPASAREARSTSFFVAVFLGILLLVSGGLNVLLLFLSIGSIAGAGLGGGVGDDGAIYDTVHFAGDAKAKTKVLRIAIHGAIAEDRNPILGAAGGTVSQVRRALRSAAADGLRGILLDIDSPGGGVTDADEIHRLIRKHRAEFPGTKVLALFGDMAASGGYYVAVAADHIMARRTTITGSIGVIMSAWNFAEAAKKVGVEQIAIKSARTPQKDLLSPTRPMREDERVLLTGIVDELYDQFVDVVDEGRPGLDRAAVLRLATGAIYTAGRALEAGLIDSIGDRDDAVAWLARELGGPVEIIEQRRRPGLRDLLFDSTGPRFLYYWQGAR